MQSVLLLLLGIFILPISHCIKCNIIYPGSNSTTLTCYPRPGPDGGTHCVAYDCGGEYLSAACAFKNFCDQSHMKDNKDKCEKQMKKKLNCRKCSEDLCIDLDGNIKKSKGSTGDDTKSNGSINLASMLAMVIE